MTKAGIQYVLEVTFPGVLIGFGGGLIVGGLAAIGGQPLSYAILAALALGVPLAIMGGGYDWLLSKGWVRLGGVAPVALYWLPAFPLARLIHEVAMDLFSGRAVALPEALLPFLAFQAIMSLGFAIGFLWLHENAGAYWWIHIRDRNPVAASYVASYTNQAATMQKSKENRDK